MVPARQLYVTRARNLARDVAPLFDLQAHVIRAMYDERRDVYGRENLPHVNLRVHLRQGERSAGARAHAQVGRPPLSKTRVVRDRRRALLQTDGAAPMLSYLLEEVAALLRGRSPGILCVAYAL